MKEIILIYIIILIFAIIFFNWGWVKNRLNFFGKNSDKIDEKEYSYICPNCGGTNVVPDLTREMIAWKGITRLRCKDCEFTAPRFLRIHKSEIEKHRKNILNKSEETKDWLRKISSSKGIIPKIYMGRLKGKKIIKASNKPPKN